MINKFLNKLSTLIFYFGILLFIIAFNFSHNPSSGWYQQFLPNTGGRQISDVFFLDSLTGWAVTPFSQQNDTVYVLKTTNGGDNWFINYRGAGQFVGMQKIYFLNELVGYACGNGFDNSNQNNFAKTTNGGSNWFQINPPDPFEVYHDLSALNQDTIWLVSSNSPTGGVFRTTNGGTNWTLQYSDGNNPDKIYMFNSRIGFIAKNEFGISVRKTTDGGGNWFLVLNGEGFTDMDFIDSLTGWKCNIFSIKKTSNGGLNWITQAFPPGNDLLNGMRSISIINNDTIWGVGGIKQYGIMFRGMIYRTTNGGNNWLYQVPDTLIHIGRYDFISFANQSKGWSYGINSGVHTVTGGDTIFYPIVNINQISSEIPVDFKLYQNYPNPFNPKTVIPYKIKSPSYVRLIVYNILGKETQRLVDQFQQAGEYEVDFMGKYGASGVYFYRIEVEDHKSKKIFTETKRMMLIK